MPPTASPNSTADLIEGLRPVAKVAAVMFAQRNFDAFMDWLKSDGTVYEPLEQAALFMALQQDYPDLTKALRESYGTSRKAEEKPTTS